MGCLTGKFEDMSRPAKSSTLSFGKNSDLTQVLCLILNQTRSVSNRFCLNSNIYSQAMMATGCVLF